MFVWYIHIERNNKKIEKVCYNKKTGDNNGSNYN